MTATIIRPATDADLAAVRACLVETWHATYDAIYGAEDVTRTTDSWHAIDVLRGQRQDPCNVFLIAEDAGTIAGTALVVRTSPDAAHLSRIYVRPAFQGQGIGAALLAASIEAAAPARRLVLEVAPANVRAIAFYQTYGFRQTTANPTRDTLTCELDLLRTTQVLPDRIFATTNESSPT